MKRDTYYIPSLNEKELSKLFKICGKQLINEACDISKLRGVPTLRIRGYKFVLVAEKAFEQNRLDIALFDKIISDDDKAYYTKNPLIMVELEMPR